MMSPQRSRDSRTCLRASFRTDIPSRPTAATSWCGAGSGAYPILRFRPKDAKPSCENSCWRGEHSALRDGRETMPLAVTRDPRSTVSRRRSASEGRSGGATVLPTTIGTWRRTRPMPTGSPPVRADGGAKGLFVKFDPDYHAIAGFLPAEHGSRLLLQSAARRRRAQHHVIDPQQATAGPHASAICERDRAPWRRPSVHIRSCRPSTD